AELAGNGLRERNDARTLSAIRIRVLLLQPTRDRDHVVACLVDRNSVSQTSYAVQVVTASPVRTWTYDIKSCPELDGPERSKMEAVRQHAGDRVQLAAQSYGLPDDILPTAESRLPGPITQHRNVRSIRDLLL